MLIYKFHASNPSYESNRQYFADNFIDLDNTFTVGALRNAANDCIGLTFGSLNLEMNNIIQLVNNIGNKQLKATVFPLFFYYNGFSSNAAISQRDANYCILLSNVMNAIQNHLLFEANSNQWGWTDLTDTNLSGDIIDPKMIYKRSVAFTNCFVVMFSGKTSSGKQFVTSALIEDRNFNVSTIPISIQTLNNSFITKSDVESIIPYKLFRQITSNITQDPLKVLDNVVNYTIGSNYNLEWKIKTVDGTAANNNGLTYQNILFKNSKIKPDHYTVLYAYEDSTSSFVKSAEIPKTDLDSGISAQNVLLNASETKDISVISFDNFKEMLVTLNQQDVLNDFTRFSVLMDKLNNSQQTKENAWYVRYFDNFHYPYVLFKENPINSSHFIILYINNQNILNEISVDKKQFLAMDSTSVNDSIFTGSTTINNGEFININQFKGAVEYITQTNSKIKQETLALLSSLSTWKIKISCQEMIHNKNILYRQDPLRLDFYQILIMDQNHTVYRGSISKNVIDSACPLMPIFSTQGNSISQISNAVAINSIKGETFLELVHLSQNNIVDNSLDILMHLMSPRTLN